MKTFISIFFLLFSWSAVSAQCCCSCSAPQMQGQYNQPTGYQMQMPQQQYQQAAYYQQPEPQYSQYQQVGYYPQQAPQYQQANYYREVPQQQYYQDSYPQQGYYPQGSSQISAEQVGQLIQLGVEIIRGFSNNR